MTSNTGRFASQPASRRTRALAVAGLVVYIAASFPLFWNFPGNDSHGEGPGHALAHLTWSAGLLFLALWLWRQRDSFAGGSGPRILVIGLFVTAAAQISEGIGATIVWATGKHADGNFAVHDAAAVVGNTGAALTLAVGLLVWAVSAVARRMRASAAAPRPR